MPTPPADVKRWVRQVFRHCNNRLTAKLSANPNVSEPSLDQSWIDELSRYSSPVRLPSGWVARIDTHFLGGLRHWGNWEIADIGILYFVRTPLGLELRKVALLQSKRLYPTTGAVEEATKSDYEFGFARLADPETLSRSLGLSTDFTFNEECRFGALLAHSNQVKAIAEFQTKNQLRVYYQFYCPWTVPHSRTVPAPPWRTPAGDPQVGVRVLNSDVVHQILEKETSGYRPKLNDLATSVDDFAELGWRLEDFVSRELLECREGDVWASTDDESIQNLFYRRSGSIAAAISITVESPDGAF